jgi:hypothetical protein
MGAVVAVAPRASSDLASGALVASAGDPSSSRIVYGIVVALIVIGVALVAVAVWVFRQTRVDPEVLAPLETMSDRRWRRLDPASQRRLLDEERPEGAEPLHPATRVPVPDEEFAAGSRPVDGFDDLKADPDDGAASEEAAGDGAAGVATLEGGDESDADRGADASAHEPSVEAAAVGETGSDAPTADVDGSDEVSPGEGGPADVDESVDETTADLDESGEPTADPDESAERAVDANELVGTGPPGGGAPDTADVSVDATSSSGGAEADTAATPDGSDADAALAADAVEPIASGSVVGPVDETPPVGETAPPPDDLEATDEPARTDG